MSGHTPGPWRVEPSGFGQVGGFTISDEANGFGLCQRPPWANRAEESAANGRLMAAAPDMLAALENVLTDCQTDNGDLPEATGHMVRAAIAKAKGGTP